MRILIDNCVSRRFARLIVGHEVIFARSMGWSDLSNGKLLAAAEADGFDVLITTDKNLPYQQNLAGRHISVITLAPRLVFYERLVPLLPQLAATLDDLRPGCFIVLLPTDEAK